MERFMLILFYQIVLLRIYRLQRRSQQRKQSSHSSTLEFHVVVTIRTTPPAGAPVQIAYSSLDDRQFCSSLVGGPKGIRVRPLATSGETTAAALWVRFPTTLAH